MITAKKVSAAFLAAVLFASPLMTTGCGKKKKNEKISSKDPWYSVNQVRIGDHFFEDKEVLSVNPEYLGLVDDKTVFLVEVVSNMPEGENEMKYEDLNIVTDYLEVYDGDGIILQSVCLDTLIGNCKLFNPGNGDFANWYLLSDYVITGDTVKVKTQAYIPTGIGEEYKAQCVDFFISINSGDIVDYKAVDNMEYRYTDSAFNFDGYRITTSSSIYMDSDDYYINVTFPDGTEAEYNTKEIIPNADIEYIAGVLYLGEGKVLFFAYPSDYSGIKTYKVDLTTGNTEEYPNGNNQLFEYSLTVSYMDGVGYIITDCDGISKIDIESNERERLFSFDDCNVNRNTASHMKLLAMTDEKIYMSAMSPINAGTVSSPELSAVDLIILTKEKTNPNAGKTILQATAVNSYSYSVCEAVARFNDTNPDYFIRIDDSYSAEAKIEKGEFSYWDSDFSEKYSEAVTGLSYQLKVDLINGEGPDIVLDGASYFPLNNSDCLIDLKPEINTDGLFENVVSAAETEGRLYQCPLAVSVTGIVASKSDVEPDQYGFTFDQYNEFVSRSCNGQDPVSFMIGREGYFLDCLKKVQDISWDSENLSYDTPSFRALAEYVKDNVSDPLIVEGESYILAPEEKDQRENKYEMEMTFPYLIHFYSDSLSELRVLGVPSFDGRGPSLVVNSSVGISAHTEYKEGCLEFVNLLLSEDVQEVFESKESYTPVSKSAFESTSLKIVDAYNENYNRNKDRFSKSHLMEFGFAWCEIDRSAVDEYEAMIISCKSMSMVDPALEMIIEEEIPAYFTGQKSLDDVISIINERSKIYLSERSI